MEPFFIVKTSDSMENQKLISSETIAAIATPPGRGGVGIVRISGNLSQRASVELLNKPILPRYATYCKFLHADQTVLDEGIAIFFPGPNSFTGEDILELHGHGGPVILDCLLKRILELGIRLAKPGEFSERAFLNDRIDLTQAEAIADLIDSESEQAAKNAVNSLQGAFSKRINTLLESLIHLRMYIEASIDFPEEEVDFLSDGKVKNDLNTIIQNVNSVLDQAKQGSLLKEGMSVVIAGRPNAGKSSLLNALSGRNSAIVTPIAGTTRDVLREHIQIDGLPLHIIDTAGLRHSADQIEQEGIRRAWLEIEKADQILLVVDSSVSTEIAAEKIWPEFTTKLSTIENITVIHNKTDLSGLSNGLTNTNRPVIALTTTNPDTLFPLKEHLKSIIGYKANSEGGFTARRRHIEALNQAKSCLLSGESQFELTGSGELLAEDLRSAQNQLSLITGQFTTEDLLGKIFSSFCIGK